MKKKIVSILLTACILMTMVGLGGCNLLEMFSSSDYTYDAEKVQASIDALTASGYKITVRYLETDTETGGGTEIQSSGFTIAADGDLWYCDTDDKEMYIDFRDDEVFVIYEKADGDEKWTKTVEEYVETGSKETLKSVYTGTYLATFTNYGVLSLGLKDKGAITVAGRACTKYEAAASGMGVSYKNEYCIDDETGLCLKNILAVGATTEGSGTMSYECTQFVVSYTITLPADSDCVTDTSEEV